MRSVAVPVLPSLVKPAAMVVVLTVLLVPPAAAQPPAEPVIDAAVQITTTPAAGRAHATPSVAVHPSDPRVVAVGQGDVFAGDCTVHVSTDAGLTWTAHPLPTEPDWPDCMYSNFGRILSVAFGPDGTLYAAHSGHDPRTYQSQVFLSRSTDLGATWATAPLPRVGPDLDGGEFGADAIPSVAVDPTDVRKVYVGWLTNNATWNHTDELLGGQEYFTDIKQRPYVAASDDGGASFGPAVDVGTDVPGYLTEPDLAVDGNGTVHAFFGSYTGGADDAAMGEPYRVYHSASTDGGATFAAEAIHTQQHPSEEANWLSAVDGAVGPGADTLYVVWEEMGTREPAVSFMRSTGAGAWTDPSTLNGEGPGTTWLFNQMFPAVSVAAGGRIDVAWYDWRDDPTFNPDADEPTHAVQQVYATYSTDDGATFVPDFRVTDRAIDRRLGVSQTFGVAGPVGIAAGDTATYVAWDDTRNGNETTQSQDVYFTRVRHAAAGAVFGASPSTAGLWWGLGGFALALVLAGVVLLAGSRRVRSAEPTRARPRRAAT